MRITLGTVQFGMRYGVANRCGRPDKEEISRVLYAAAELGVSMLDTAPGYGDVEKMLGSGAPSGVSLPVLYLSPLRQSIQIRSKASRSS